MYLLLIVVFGTLAKEAASSLGKHAIHRHTETLNTMAFLGSFWSAIFLGVTVLFGVPFIFQLESLPFFITRLILEITLAHIAIKAVVLADRSTAAFLHSVTIPLLLFTDLIIGYTLSLNQLLGVITIIAAILLLFTHNPASKRGSGYAVTAAVLAVATISLYKHNITNFNSVAAEQIVLIICLLIYFGIASRLVSHEHPLRLLIRPYSGLQSLSSGMGGAILSFAYLFAPASIVIATKRALEVVWSIVFGRVYFHEVNLGRKLTALFVMMGGLALIGLS